MRLLRIAALPVVLLSAGCLRTPPPTENAIQNSDLCSMYITQGDLERADIHCDLAIQFAPQWADPYVNKAHVQFLRGQVKQAKDTYVKALRLNPDQKFAHSNLGVIYRSEGNLGRAHDAFQRALKIDPNYREARYNLALTLKQMGRVDDARRQYKTLLAIDPNVADAYNDMGVMDLEATAYQSAMDNFTKAVELDPSYGAAHMGLGSALMEMGRFPECAAAYTACIDVDPNNFTCRNNLTVCNRKAALSTPAENATGALDACAENSAPEDAAACLYAKAKSLAEQGLRVEQEKALKRCAQENPRFALCHFDLFLIFQEDRKDGAARTACSNFMRAATREEYPDRFEDCDRFMASGTF